MGVDTKGILRKGVTIEQIADVISEAHTDVSVYSYQHDFMQISFKDGNDNRTLSVSFTNTCEHENGIPGVWVSLGCFGNSVEIVKELCARFGGYIDENDCDDEGFYPVNFEEYQKGEEMTEMDNFRHEVISVLGYSNLKKAIDLFEKFKKIA